MYVRFFRWASDRLVENGIIALVTNRSFVDSHTFDGFRKVIADEFTEAWLVDLGGDVRENPKLSGTKHNVFGIQTGVAISFFVKRAKGSGTRIFYSRRPELETGEEKLAWLDGSKLRTVACEEVKPDAKGNWIDHGDSEFDTLLSLINPNAKTARTQRSERAIFKLFSPGLKSQRDEWVYALSRETLATKMRYFIGSYELARTKQRNVSDTQIKWDSELERYRKANIEKKFDSKMIVDSPLPAFLPPTLILRSPFHRQAVPNAGNVSRRASGKSRYCFQ